MFKYAQFLTFVPFNQLKIGKNSTTMRITVQYEKFQSQYHSSFVEHKQWQVLTNAKAFSNGQ